MNEKLNPKLDFLWLEITKKCNLECVHCYVESGPSLPVSEGMLERDWIDILAQARAVGCHKVQFIGGEPTLHPALPNLIRVAYALGFSFIEIFTNATKVSKPLMESFETYGVRVATSFYSKDKNVHDDITLQDGSFQKTVNTIQSFLSAGIPLRVEVIELGTHNPDFSATKSFLLDLGVKTVSHDRVRNVGRGTASSKPSYSGGDLCGQCWRGKLCVTSSGEAYPCIMARSKAVGNAKTDSLRSLLLSDKLLNFRKTMKKEIFSEGPIQSTPISSSHSPIGLGATQLLQGDCGPGPKPDTCGPALGGVGYCGPEYCGPVDPNCGPTYCAPKDPYCAPSNCGPDSKNSE